MIRILEVTYQFGYGGITSFILQAIRHIDRTSYKVDIYAFGATDSPFADELHRIGVDLYMEPRNISSRHIGRFVARLRRHLHLHGPYDVVHAHNNLISAWVLLAAAEAHVPCRIAHSHATDHFKSSILQQHYSRLRQCMIARLATTQLACGQMAGQAMYGAQAPFHVLPNGIEVDDFYYVSADRVEQLRCQLSLPDDAIVYASVSRMDYNKNHLFTLRVFEHIAHIQPSAYLVIGGADTDIAVESSRHLIAQAISSSPYAHRIRLVGVQHDMPALYHLCHCFLLPSLLEGFPLAPLELQASVTPCLLSDTITHEVDLDLGMLTYLSLSDSPALWARTAIQAQRGNYTYDQCINTFTQRGFTSQANARLLEHYYSLC